MGLAELIAQTRDDWPGEVVIVFQPADEGTRGGVPMAAAGVVDRCVALVCCHIGAQSRETGHVIGGVSHFLATKKFDVEYLGHESHAALEPEAGCNALLGAATAALNLHAIARHSHGSSRVNVGMLNAGSARNVVASRAILKAEVRGETEEVLAYAEGRARRIFQAAADMHDLTLRVDVAGACPGTGSDSLIAKRVGELVRAVPEVRRFDEMAVAQASDDAAALMQRVQQRGGFATYLIFGARLAAGHHMPTFDFDEAALSIGLKVLALLARNLAENPPPRRNDVRGA
jgi:aminobenzoyl-glutamate utilization protein A